jgi:uncharacterized protein
MINRIPIIIMLVWLSLGGILAADVEPAPKTYVADRANVIDSDTETKLVGLLQELEQKTKARLVVLTVNTTDGMDIHQYAFERADAWKFGTNRQSASVLIVVAVKDRKYWTEVGYDHEAILTDGYVGEVGRQYFVPHFKAGRFGQGTFEGAAIMAQKIAQERGVSLTGMPNIRPMTSQPGLARVLVGILPLLFLFLIAGASRGRHRNMLFWGFLAGSMLGGRSGGFGGGGFGGGGGGFGGFGGGGGGGFGGGGAGGSW